MKKLLILILPLFLFSCSKFLDREPLSNPSDGTFWKTGEDALKGLNAVYSTLPDSRDFWRDCNSDNSVMTNAWGEGGMGYICQGSQSAADGYIREEWNYPAIRIALNFLDKVKDANMDALLKRRYIAEARFVLAYRYFRMAQIFGDIPLIKEKPVSLDEAALTKSPKQEVLDYALLNADSAVTVIPASFAGSNAGRINKAAALMLRANIYLYMASYKKFHNGQDDASLWKKAADDAKAVVDLNLYDLENDFLYIFTQEANNNNKEVILAYQYVKNEITQFLPVLASPTGCSITGEGWASFCPTRDLIDSYECTDGQSIYASPLYDKSNPWGNRDKRLTETFFLPGMPAIRPDGTYQPFQPHPSYGKPEALGANGAGGGITGYLYVKFAEPTNPEPYDSYTNWPIYRYAETLLILAEALNEYSPGNAQIAWALNKIRSRAGLPGVPNGATQAQVRDMIRNERRHEFVAEHKRYFDILRWKIAETVLNTPAYGINSNVNDPIGDWTKPKYLAQERKFIAPKMYYWPIPQDALNKNPNLGQNPNWK